MTARESAMGFETLAREVLTTVGRLGESGLELLLLVLERSQPIEMPRESVDVRGEKRDLGAVLFESCKQVRTRDEEVGKLRSSHVGKLLKVVFEIARDFALASNVGSLAGGSEKNGGGRARCG